MKRIEVGSEAHENLKSFCKKRGYLIKIYTDKVIEAGIEALKQKEEEAKA